MKLKSTAALAAAAILLPLAVQAQNVTVVNGKPVEKARVDMLLKQATKAGQPVTPDTRFAIGSVTKQFACACLLLLAEDGRLAVDDKVAK